MPYGGGEGEESLQDAGADAGAGLAAVAFEIELGFEGLVDGLDDLAECFESLAAWSGFLGFERGRIKVMPALLSSVSKAARR